MKTYLKAIGSTICMFMLLFSFEAMAKGGKNIIGPDKCTKCHKEASKAWQKTHHFLAYKKLHKRPKAKEIATKMGIKGSVKKSPVCAQCHYTTNSAGKAKWGVSCESCHGAAEKWVKIHNDYGGKTVTKESEDAAHREKRIANAQKNGMIRPENIYAVAENCFQCHTVPNEKLVEVGGHKAGSDFELVSWSQGEVRHNYQNDTKSNKEASADDKRVMYVVGRLLDLEYGLRGVANVTKKSSYAVEMAKRTKRALGYLKQINGAVSDSELKAAFDVGSSAQLKPNNKAALLAAAKKVGGHAQKFAKNNDGSKLAALDELIPGETKGKAMR